MPFPEDLSPFFTEFATPALFDGVAEPVSVIFDAAADRSALGEMGMGTIAPAITLRTADVPVGVQGRGVEIQGARYEVAENQPDGTGVSILFLTKLRNR